MYKYQEELTEQIVESLSQIEDMTEEHYVIHIGNLKDSEWERMGYPTDIYAETNAEDYFAIDDVYFSKSQLTYKTVKFDEDIFLKFNKLIDKVIKDNKERKEFTEKLTEEMRALNKALKNSNKGEQ